MAESGIIEPWERQPDESRRSYEAFKRYLDMGAQRSLAKVARSYADDPPVAGQKVTKGVHTLKLWSARHRWVERVEAWEKSQDDEWLAERRHIARETCRRHAAIARRMTGKVDRKLRQINPSHLEPSDVARWLDIAVKVERQSIGLSTNTVSGTGQGGAIAHTVAHEFEASTESLIRKLGAQLAGNETPSVFDEPDEK